MTKNRTTILYNYLYKYIALSFNMFQLHIELRVIGVRVMLVYIYIDVLFIENFIINYIILILTSTFIKRYIQIWRYVLGAFIGSLYSLFVFFPSMKIYYTCAAKFIISLIIVGVVFFSKKLKIYIRNLVIFYIINILMGGTMFSIFYLNGNAGYYNNGVMYIYNFPLKIFLFGIMGTYIGYNILKKFVRNKKRYNDYISFFVSFDDKQVKIKGLVDSGNFLNDPLSKKPVIVIEYNALRNILPEDIAKIYEDNSVNDFDSVAKVIINSKWLSRFRLIPFSSLGVKNGMIIGFKPDAIKFIDSSNLIIKDVIVAIYRNSLSDNDKYQALLNPDVFNLYNKY